MKIGIVLTSKLILSSDQVRYLKQAISYLQPLFELDLTFFVQDQPFELLKSFETVSICDAMTDLTPDFLNQHEIHVLITPYFDHLTLCEPEHELVVCYVHQTKTLYPCQIIAEADVFHQPVGMQFLNMMGTLQEHPAFLVLIQLLKTNKTGITTHSASHYTLLKGKVNNTLYLFQAATEDVLRFENPTCYIKAIAPLKTQWFTGESAGILFI